MEYWSILETSNPFVSCLATPIPEDFQPVEFEDIEYKEVDWKDVRTIQVLPYHTNKPYMIVP